MGSEACFPFLGARRSCLANLSRLGDTPHLDVLDDHTALLGVNRPAGLPETALSPEVVGGMLFEVSELVSGSSKRDEGKEKHVQHPN